MLRTKKFMEETMATADHWIAYCGRNIKQNKYIYFFNSLYQLWIFF